MKPVTNILLVLAIVCYAFLPFYDMAFQGGLSGLELTAGLISRTDSLRVVVFALVPFIMCFLGIGLNSLKSKYWSALALLVIVGGLYFFHATRDFHSFALIHQPEVTPGDDLGEGFAIESLSWGFYSSCALSILSAVSAALSLLPFKFNDAIERVVDDAVDKSLEGSRKHIKALGHEVRDEWNKLEAKTKNTTSKLTKHKAKGKNAEAQPENEPTPASPEDAAMGTPPPIPEDKEDDSRFMPK